MTSFSCDTLFAQIEDDLAMPRDYQLGGGSSGDAFTVTSFSGENIMPDLKMMQVLPGDAN